MCNPTLVVAGLSAGMQYQQAITQQKYKEAADRRQNEIAAKNLAYRRKASTLKLKQSTEKNLKKLEEENLQLLLVKLLTEILLILY